MFLMTNGIGMRPKSSCPWWAWVAASVAIAYTIASIIYLIGSRAMGTPFNDSLSVQQRQLKAMSSKRRGALFLISFAVCLVLCALVIRFALV